jgi:hypothetical protein
MKNLLKTIKENDQMEDSIERNFIEESKNVFELDIVQKLTRSLSLSSDNSVQMINLPKMETEDPTLQQSLSEKISLLLKVKNHSNSSREEEIFGTTLSIETVKGHGKYYAETIEKDKRSSLPVIAGIERSNLKRSVSLLDINKNTLKNLGQAGSLTRSKTISAKSSFEKASLTIIRNVLNEVEDYLAELDPGYQRKGTGSMSPSKTSNDSNEEVVAYINLYHNNYSDGKFIINFVAHQEECFEGKAFNNVNEIKSPKNNGESKAGDLHRIDSPTVRVKDLIATFETRSSSPLNQTESTINVAYKKEHVDRQWPQVSSVVAKLEKKSDNPKIETHSKDSEELLDKDTLYREHSDVSEEIAKYSNFERATPLPIMASQIYPLRGMILDSECIDIESSKNSDSWNNSIQDEEYQKSDTNFSEELDVEEDLKEILAIANKMNAKDSFEIRTSVAMRHATRAPHSDSAHLNENYIIQSPKKRSLIKKISRSFKRRFLKKSS